MNHQPLMKTLILFQQGVLLKTFHLFVVLFCEISGGTDKIHENTVICEFTSNS